MFHDVVSGSDVRAASASAVAVRRMVCYVQYFNFFQWMSSNAVFLCELARECVFYGVMGVHLIQNTILNVSD